MMKQNNRMMDKTNLEVEICLKEKLIKYIQRVWIIKNELLKLKKI